MTKTTRTSANASQEHAAAAAKINQQLDQLRAAMTRKLAEHAGERVHFGHVGDLVHYSSQLGALLDQLNKTGEYAA